MGCVNYKGIVIKEVNTGEADKIVTVLTAEEGKISVAAKNARRTKNSLSSGTQLLCFSDYMLFKGKELYNMSCCEVIEPNYEIRNDIYKLTYSSHILDLIYDNVQEGEPSESILRLLLNTLYVIAKTERPLELVTRVFELRLMALLGYEPQVSGCINCNKTDDENMYFDLDNSGIVCGECVNPKGRVIPLLPGTVKALKYIMRINPQKLFSFSLSEQSIKELGIISRKYIKEHLGKEYNKLDYLKQLI
ncbi:DNA repair protein RecO [Ruminiclostridium cellobioparum]|jgi:DNA repair protein RecO (recombination protein O)|uniref:DNA repair protein RecO n=1 Tax=Ruminiclostridium cellobioparum subsp. termitidis CT1112 TaxID=1195236 RepID=S0FJW4_RUMCE|nr:DNA repair protein RecO [Ruminiclostridium cellobioparum]EMS69414.1 DNA repair protein RecO [Ruminiclostridium cellobioparum subsp. termitidis CT1112]